MTGEPVILDARGRPARQAAAAAKSTKCPRCGAPSERRVKSAGFGDAHPVCELCGYEWHDEVWRD